jgi:hypothetical protein
MQGTSQHRHGCSIALLTGLVSPFDGLRFIYGSPPAAEVGGAQMSLRIV